MHCGYKEKSITLKKKQNAKESLLKRLMFEMVNGKALPYNNDPKSTKMSI